MALFDVQVFKEHPFAPGRPWSNTYTLESSTLDHAVAAAGEIQAYELLIHDSNTTITYMRVSTQTPHDGSYTNVVVNQAGTRSTSGDTLPLFNTVRLDGAASVGNPSRWHYRGLHEGEVANNEVAGGVRTVIEEAYANMVEAVNAGEVAVLTQSGGTLLTGAGACAINVKLRKQHRRRRKSAI